MHYKHLRVKLRRQFRMRRRQVAELGSTADKGIERNVFRRFRRLLPVRRFVIGWIALMGLLIGCSLAQFQHLAAFYQRLQPVPGGIYTEGVVGSISNVNPIYATSDVDRSLSRLLFSGLLTYDANGKLSNGLAKGYTVDATNKVYTVTLKPGLTWHDGRPLTAADVAFTFATIKDPDARSPLLSSWQNVKVEASGPLTVKFTLPGPLASFPYSLTTGIVPQHILGKVSAANMRSTDFNTVSPVGSGPFLWHGLEVSGNDPANAREQVALLPFDKYVGGKPKLAEFILQSYASQERLTEAFRSGQLSGVAGLPSLPTDAPASAVRHDMLLSAGNFVFYKTSGGVLSDPKVRQALNAAARPDNIITGLGYTTKPVTEPLLLGQLAYNKAYAQKTNDAASATALLTQAGWLAGQDGTLRKDGKPLRFSLVANDTPEARIVTSKLRAQWKAVGVKADVQLLSTADYATALAGHEYDATLYGISIGQDPDVYAYWDSSQADVRSSNRLNLSEWNNPVASAALEAGRSRLDPQLRTIKYAPFLQAWQQDAPALGLYQPRFLYLTRGALYGLTDHAIANSIDRYNNVQNWQIRTARVTE